ncbi:MAG TPA: ABC transporter ATP-binding protein [Symbiobacteriaceae bacterium]|nr:ABC transporter ATP-binding protein [Symbiobacteriaceae bacterium]
MTFYRDWWRTLLTVFRASPRTSALSLVVMVMMGLLPASELRAFWGLIDAVVSRSDWGAVARWLGLAAVLMLAQPLLQRLAGLLQVSLQREAHQHLISRLLERAARMPLLEFESPAYFNLYNRASQGVREYIPMMVQNALNMGGQLLAVLGLMVTLVAISWQATLILVVVAVPAWVVQARFASAWGNFLRAQVPRARYLDYLGELLVQRQYAQEVRLFGTARYVLERWWKERSQLGAERNGFALKRGFIQVATLGLGDLAQLGSLTVTGFAVLAGRTTLGAFSGALKAVDEVQGAVLGFMFQLGFMKQWGHFVTDYWSFVDTPGALPDSPVGPAPDRTDVVFDGVSFCYPGKAEPVLAGVGFSVKPGELVALVGENGAGKTTLVKLLLGLYPPGAGSVRVGGVEVSAPEGAGARGAIASVFQDFIRYSLKAGENIAVGDVRALDDRARVEAAAAGSGADAVIAGLPQGYNTQLGKEFEGGQELSGGQWQKLAIARAYMRHAAILVLDEPTAALDPLAEVEVFQRFRELARGRTAFFISHRLGAARLADRILVLKQGQLVEDGTHDELIATGGEYAALFEAQAAWYRATPEEETTDGSQSDNEAVAAAGALAGRR